jgi:hypothetical protein
MLYQCQSCGTVTDLTAWEQKFRELYASNPNLRMPIPSCPNCGQASLRKMEKDAPRLQSQPVKHIIEPEHTAMLLRLLGSCIAGFAVAQIPYQILSRLGVNNTLITLVVLAIIVAVSFSVFKVSRRLGPPDIKKLINSKDIEGLINAMGYIRKNIDPNDPQAPVTLNLEIHDQAVEALTKINKEAIDHLIVALDDKEKLYIRIGACKVLGNIRAKQAVDRLIVLLEDKQAEVRSAAAEGLGKIGDARGVQPLEKAVSASDKNLAKAASLALEKIKPKKTDPVQMKKGATLNLPQEEQKLNLCKAYQDGSCIVRGRNSGSCTWNPANWESCGVVLENKKAYGTW